MRRNQGKLLGLLACAVALLAAIPAVAAASNHLIKIREVFPGDAAHPASEYVELQMYAPGQNLFNFGTTTTLYDASGSATTAFSTAGFNPSQNPPNSESQARVLIASPDALTEFGVSAGYQFAAGDHLSPLGGAACYEPTSLNNDCVSWGNFNNTSGTPLPSITGGNVDGARIPEGKALNRLITKGCATMLEAGDDTNSPGDWHDVDPAPLNNAATPPELPCPDTKITKRPARNTTDRTPTFKFEAIPATSATFQCKLDKGHFKDCGSPLTTSRLALGKHTFRVRAINSAGGRDPSPAKTKFKVVKKHR